MQRVAYRRQYPHELPRLLLIRLDAGLTPEQRALVSRRLDGYVSTIDTVVASR